MATCAPESASTWYVPAMRKVSEVSASRAVRSPSTIARTRACSRPGGRAATSCARDHRRARAARSRSHPASRSPVASTSRGLLHHPTAWMPSRRAWAAASKAPGSRRPRGARSSAHRTTRSPSMRSGRRAVPPTSMRARPVTGWFDTSSTSSTSVQRPSASRGSEWQTPVRRTGPASGWPRISGTRRGAASEHRASTARADAAASANAAASTPLESIRDACGRGARRRGDDVQTASSARPGRAGAGRPGRAGTLPSPRRLRTRSPPTPVAVTWLGERQGGRREAGRKATTTPRRISAGRGGPRSPGGRRRERG